MNHYHIRYMTEVTNFRMSYFERSLNLHLLISDEFFCFVIYFPISDDVFACGRVGLCISALDKAFNSENTIGFNL